MVFDFQQGVTAPDFINYFVRPNFGISCCAYISWNNTTLKETHPPPSLPLPLYVIFPAAE